MSNDLNQCQFIGRLGQAPEMRYMQNGDAVASFSIACGSSWKDKATGEKQERTEWVSCTAFGKLAEIIGEYLGKGSQVYVSGKLKTEKYEKDGQTRYSTKVIVDNMQMLGGKREGEQQDQRGDSSSAPARRPAPAQRPESSGSSFDNFDDDIPFAFHGMPGAGVSWRAM